jgi:hypothetical protein
MNGYDFHPEVEIDFAEIWDSIAEDSTEWSRRFRKLTQAF